MKKIFLTIILLLFSATSLFAGTAHYVDSGAAGGGNGMWATPFKTIAEVNAHNFSTGDDVYFKVGQTWSEPAGLTIDWYGADGEPPDYVTIGAWEAEGDFVLEGGETKPIIDGNNFTYPTADYGSLIRRELSSQGTGWIKVENIKVQDSKWYGILFKKTSNIIVTNCETYRNSHGGICIVRTHTGEITNNFSDYDSYTGVKSCSIYINGGNYEQAYGFTVSGNTVTRGHEGIGLYKKATNNIVEHNTLYDNDSYSIYVDAGSSNIIRYNLVYNSATGPPDGEGLSSLIHMDNELERGYCFYDDNEIYGNLVAGGKQGITVANTMTSCASSGHKIYNNTIVDCQTNIKVESSASGATHSDVNIKNNISWTITDGDSIHVSGCSESGVTWNNNLWSSDPGPGTTDCDNDATDPANASPELSKASGWRSLTAGGVTGSEFELTSGSPAASGGTDLGTSLEYVLIPGTGDMSEDPPDAFTPADADDYGGWPYGAFLGGLTISAGYPTSLQECTTDPRAVTFGVTSSANATCKFTINGSCATAYGDLAETFGTTGTTTHSDADEEFDCDSTDTVVVICNDGSYDSNCLEITVDVAPPGGTPPQPSPTGIVGDGNVTLGGGGNVTVGAPL